MRTTHSAGKPLCPAAMTSQPRLQDRDVNDTHNHAHQFQPYAKQANVVMASRHKAQDIQT